MDTDIWEAISLINEHLRDEDQAPSIGTLMQSLSPCGIQVVHAAPYFLDEGASPRVRILILNIITLQGHDAQSLLPELIGCLDDPNRLVRLAALEAISPFGGRARAAIPILRRWLNEPGELSVMAACNIPKIDPSETAEMLSVISEALTGQDSKLRDVAILNIGSLGTDACPVVPELRQLLDENDLSAALAAGRAIWEITGDPNGAVDACLGSIPGIIGIDLLYEIGPAAVSAVDRLRCFLVDEDEDLRECAAMLLARIEGTDYQPPAPDDGVPF